MVSPPCVNEDPIFRDSFSSFFLGKIPVSKSTIATPLAVDCPPWNSRPMKGAKPDVDYLLTVLQTVSIPPVPVPWHALGGFLGEM